MFRTILKEHRDFKNQIFKLSRSELIKTYKGAALGPLWAVIKPAITIFVYWFAFQIGLRANRSIEGIPFFLFLMTGMIPWFFMHDAILDGSACFRKKKAFITKMSFPVSTIPTYTLLSNLYIHLLLCVLMYAVLLISGVSPSIYNLQFFFYMPIMYVCFLFLSWILAPLSAVSRDFQNLVKAIITALFWLSGIIWDPFSLSNDLLRRVVTATPITYFANGYRNAFLFEKWFFMTRYETFCCLIWIVGFLIVGVYTYKRARRVIPDVL